MAHLSERTKIQLLCLIQRPLKNFPLDKLSISDYDIIKLKSDIVFGIFSVQVVFMTNKGKRLLSFLFYNCKV